MPQSSAYSQLMSDMQQDAASPQTAAQPSLGDQAVQGMFNARDDIRHRLVEEAWTGQQQTGDVQLVDYQTIPDPDVPTLDPDAGNIWGNDDSPEWHEGGSVWANEANPGVWGHENAPDMQDASIEPLEIEAPEPEQLEP